MKTKFKSRNGPYHFICNAKDGMFLFNLIIVCNVKINLFILLLTIKHHIRQHGSTSTNDIVIFREIMLRYMSLL